MTLQQGRASAAALATARAAAGPLARAFDAAGYRLYLVGGVVREALSGRFLDGADLDCTTDARPDALRGIVAPVASTIWTPGERYGTIGCVVDGQAFEITTHRAERYADDSRKPVVAFGDNVLEDLVRRDFTVNAMAVDTRDGTLLDPHGGRRDLAAKVLRTPLDPEVSFGDDPLRMLRAARFVASHALVPETRLVAAACSMVQRLSIVSAERIRDELQKLLLLDDPCEGLRFLFHTGLVTRVLRWCVTADVELLCHTSAALTADLDARWAVLFLHDRASAAPGLRELRASNSTVNSVERLLEAHTRLMSAANTVSEARRLLHAYGADLWRVLEFSEAVVLADGQPGESLRGLKVTLEELASGESREQLSPPLSGDDVMEVLEIAPGPAVGRAIAFLQELVFERGPITRSDAVSALRGWWPDYSSAVMNPSRFGYAVPDASGGRAEASGNRGPGVDFRLVRAATLRAWRSGELSRVEVCDAQRELHRNAEHCGEATNRACPVCDELHVVEVTYVFGSRLPKHGRCITTQAEMQRLKQRATPSTGYVVEVCTSCGWNHLMRSFILGRKRSA